LKNNKEPKDEYDELIKYIKSESHQKIDYALLFGPIRDGILQIKGKYSSLKEGIAYIDPKVNEPHELIQDRPPRKVMIDRMKKVYATINIETLLKKVNIDYGKVDELDKYFPLEFFEDKDLDIYTPDQWIEKSKDMNGVQLYIPGVGLYVNEEGAGLWRRVLINNFDKKGERFEGIWDDEKKGLCELSKINLLFDAENPYLFLKKVSLAHLEREKSASIIKYNLYIDKMVIDGLPELPEEQKVRLRKGLDKIPFYKQGIEPKQIDDLLKELNLNYLRTTNKIIFDKFYSMGIPNQLILSDLKLPENILNNHQITKAPERGLIDVPDYQYIEFYKKFTFKTLLCRKEIIECLQKIKDECNQIREKLCLFQFDIKRPMRLQEFKQIQKSEVNKVYKKLEGDWVKTLKETLEKSLMGVGKGSFNLNVASKEIYEYLKLKKYMTVVKLVMQDTLYALVFRSMTGYLKFFDNFIPYEVDVNDVNDVVNKYYPEEVEDKLNTTNDLINAQDVLNSFNTITKDITGEEDEFIVDPGEKWPLFQINITKKDDRRIEYTTKEKDLIDEILGLFDWGLTQMQQIPQVEPLLLPNLIKKAEKQKIPLKSIVRTKGEKPEPITPDQIRDGFELNDDSIWIWELYENLKANLQMACEPLHRYLKTFDKYHDDLALDINKEIRKIRDNKDIWTNQKVRDDILKNKEKERNIMNEIPQVIHVSMFQINCKEFRTDLSSKYGKLADLQIEYLKEKASNINKAILLDFTTIRKRISNEIVTIQDLIDLQNYIAELPLVMQTIRDRNNEVDELYEMLDSLQVHLDTIQFSNRMDIIGGPTEIDNTIKVTNISLEKKKDLLYNEQLVNQERLKDDIDLLVTNIKALSGYFNEEGRDGEEAILLNTEIFNNLNEVMSKAQMYNERERLFDKPLTNYQHIYELKNQFDPYYWLWTSINKWKTKRRGWEEDNFSLLKGDDVYDTLSDINKDLKNALIKFKDREADEKIVSLTEKYKLLAEKFKPKCELAMALTKKGIMQHHWEEIMQKTGIDCTPREGLTFKQITDNGMLKHLETCQEIGEKAYREYILAEQLDKLEKIWKENLFNIKKHHISGVNAITNWMDINKQLDEDLLLVNQLEVSPFKGPYAGKISKWLEELILVSNVLEEWNKCQKKWIYLQPVFDSGDIAKDIPHEHKKFMMTDRMWRELMENLAKNLVVKTNCLHEGVYDKLKEANMNLESVEKGLNAYMEKKRAKFPRFYFISNAMFLEILSQTKDIKKVKDNLGKIFESIDNIELQDDKLILSFQSRLNESITLNESIFIFGRNIEEWMKQLENTMFLTIREYLERGLIDYEKKERKDWILDHPGQVLMACNQIMWTKEVENAIKENTLAKYLSEYDEKIMDLVKLVRKPQNRLTGINISNLLTLDVHNKNIINTLISEKINEITNFEWTKHLRYYWMNNFVKGEPRMDCIIKSVQTDFPYGYEYTGNNEILVITPLTDKCYLTLMGALRLNLGGNPVGPAGTGKTESTKDLARCLAKHCLVYNCTDDTDYEIIGKFFKGLANCGSWICFDEFNRINIEVLSVISQQLKALFEAKETKTTEIIFEGSKINVLPTFCVFITMNPPGYGGRTELPDNLKARFRPICMMVPDYGLISQINLYSAGYAEAESLATKVVSTMKLCSEQLSSQGHYDFGMRSVKSILNAARRLKRTEQNVSESQLLLRALQDVNVPKFVKEDVPLFNNIIQDLFPGAERSKINYDEIYEKVNIVCKDMNLIPTDNFKYKIIQLYDTIQVRHGLMLVGPAGGGKSACLNVLKKSLSMLKDGVRFFETLTYNINPKAITHAQIYSEKDESTGEWSYGVLPIIINGIKSNDVAMNNKHWVIFDGPVDPIWIEDMNSVLDDSKKLCLASSDIILLTENITLMFEVEDLLVASPATVSRCGMIYMEPSALGHTPVIKCWLKTLPDLFVDYKIGSILEKLFDTYLEEVLYYVRKKVKEPVPTVDNNLTKSLMKIIDTFFDKYKLPEAKLKKYGDELKALESNIEAIFYYSLVWSLGVTSDEEGRIKFDQFIKDLFNSKATNAALIPPKEGSIYDYFFDVEKGEWVKWINIIGNFEIPHDASYTEIIVPTPDSIRNTTLVKQLVKSSKHVITAGPTGTGKTKNIVELLTKGLPENKYLSIIINFSAQTTARQTQDSIDSKLEKKGINKYGPIGNDRHGAIFIDDLNIPVREPSGAQPPIELLRQWLDHKGWYELKSRQLKFVDRLIMIGAMGPPGGGRSLISQRFQRHFNLVVLNELEDASVMIIFKTIVSFFLARFTDQIKESIDNVIVCTQTIYKDIKVNLLPTPKKMHYMFNLRDISKVLQGVCSASNKFTTSRVDVIRLWMHEMTRVFGDRLVDDEDRDWLKSRIETEVTGRLNADIEDIYHYGKKLIFCDFMGEGYPRNYCQVTDPKMLIKKINQKLDEYNDDSKRKKLKLVMFLDACDHVSRISRILRAPQGNALLLGVGGSGRQSLAKLANFINGYDIHQIEVVKNYGMSEFSKNVKEILKSTGVKNSPSTFLIVDTQIVVELMLEYVNNILNSGDVPNLYNKEDIEYITPYVKNEVLSKYNSLADSNIMKVFVSRVLKNIHVVLAMSPVGDSFTKRIRNFPSLVNCTTIDWFTEWPEDALESVALDSVRNSSLNLDQYVSGLVQSFKFIHKRVEVISREYSNELRRQVYLTPTSYLELLNIYQKILTNKRGEIQGYIDRLTNGLEVLKLAQIEVNKMRIEIDTNKPILEENQKKTKILVENLNIETQKAKEEEELATQAEEEANRFDVICTEILITCEQELKRVQPLIDTAKNAIENVKTADLNNVIAFPNLGLKGSRILEGLIIFKKGYAYRTKDYINKKWANDKENENEYDIKKALALIDFRDANAIKEDLKSYCANDESLKFLKTTNLVNMNLLSNYIEEKNIDKNYAAKASGFYVGLFEFLKCLSDYVKIAIKDIDPVLEALGEAQTNKAKATNTKDEALAKKTAAQNLVKTLNETLEKELANEKILAAKIEDSQKKLDRANQLINLLSGEQDRWNRDVINFKKQIENLIGDSLIAAGAISYCGPFTSNYRARLESDWRNRIKEIGLIHTEGITMRGVLEDKVEVAEWNVNGLQSDSLSIENAIIIKNTRRWPLIIDPQNQGSNFIKKLGKKKEILEVIKASDPNFLAIIIGCIRNGKWALLENVGVNLDPSLEPILTQQITEKGGYAEIRIGDSSNPPIPWSYDFKLHLSTTIPNPHYSPETFVKVTILNFGITPQGLEEQMLTLLINYELPELELRKNAILKENFAAQEAMKRTENKILSELSKGEGGNVNISEFLDSDSLINTLKEAKTKAEEIKQKIIEAEETSKEITKQREAYTPAAYRAALLFFATLDLSSIDPMYQYSLQWFSYLYEESIKNTPNSNKIETRIDNLNNKFSIYLYNNVCRSLFEKDKLLFSFVICHKILTGEQKDKIDQDVWRYFLAGPLGEIRIRENPTNWISKNEWNNFYRQLKYMNDHFKETKGLEEYFMNNHEKFKILYDSNTMHKDPLPDRWNDLSDFMRLCVVKMIRPDKVILAIQQWIERNMGKEFVEPEQSRLEIVFKDARAIIPILYILSPGSDPINEITAFAKSQGFYEKKFVNVSLGRGQEKRALEALQEMRTKGGWVLLENCHLAKSFMGKLEEIVENFDTDWPDKDFRLWLTSMSNPLFPVSILQNSVKLTNEPPKGLKSNLVKTYNKIKPEELESCSKPNEYKSFLFGLSFFHAIVQDRRKYGPIGWNVKYDFTNEDWDVCRRQIKIFLEDYDKIPYEVLDYLLGDINYGGRVSDDKDNKLIKQILRTYITPEIFKFGEYKFSKSGTYYCPEPGEYENYMLYIQSLPVNSDPEVFGLHENADIVTAQNECYSLLETVLEIQPRVTTSSGISQENVIINFNVFRLF
jgi:dynein heavy chain